MNSTTIAAPAAARPLSAKSRWGRAGIAGVLGCMCWCAVPYAATVLGAGAATSVARFARPGTELVAGGLAFAAALGWMTWRRRSRGTLAACGGACAPEHGATSASKISVRGAPDAPLVCTADLSHAQIQIDGYRAAFAHLVDTKRLPGGFRWTFRSTLGLEAQLMGLAERESQCCPFLSFELTRAGESIVWEVSARDEAASIVEEFFRLPERLEQEPRAGYDVELLKRTAKAAGLIFEAPTKEG
jgi:hypothetical protein